MPNEEEIVHVSDTALMVAACRAMETARPDGLVRDPFVERLAGARGMAIARNLPGWEVMCFGVGMRSRFLDDLVTHVAATLPVTTVVSVGCGLDTRPWRLDLPPALRWIEVDFASMLDYKAGVLAEEKPKCRLERIAADLNDGSQQQAVFATAGSAPGLMISEGLLTYLPAETVEALAAESAAQSGIRYWLLDLASPYLERRVGMDSRQAIRQVQAADRLNGLEILDVLGRNGWTSARHRSYTRDSMEIAAARILAARARAGAAAQTEQPPPADRPQRCAPVRPVTTLVECGYFSFS